MEIIIRIINGLITATAVLVLVNFVYGLVMKFKIKMKTFEFNISVIYWLIWIIKFFAIRA